MALAGRAGVHCFFDFHSPGSVSRILQAGLAARDGRPEEPAMSNPRPKIVEMTAAPAPPPPTFTLEEEEVELLRVFGEAEAALALAKECALVAIRVARQSAKQSEAFRALKEFLNQA
jgi:hypothetical protein